MDKETILLATTAIVAGVAIMLCIALLALSWRGRRQYALLEAQHQQTSTALALVIDQLGHIRNERLTDLTPHQPDSPTGSASGAEEPRRHYARGNTWHEGWMDAYTALQGDVVDGQQPQRSYYLLRPSGTDGKLEAMLVDSSIEQILCVVDKVIEKD